MNYLMNEDYVWIKKDDGISITSILPDQNEIFHFKGDTAKILEEWLKTKTPVTDLTKYEMEIDPDDWKNFIDFLAEKKILITG